MEKVNKILKVPSMETEGKKIIPEHYDIGMENIEFFMEVKVLDDISLLYFRELPGGKKRGGRMESLED